MAQIVSLQSSLQANQAVERRGFFKKILALATGGVVFGAAGKVHAAPQTLDPFIGQIILFAGNFAPSGWALCNGQLLPIAGNASLYSLLGNVYGGTAPITFALPDLRGRVPIHAGTGPSLTPRTIGDQGGAETHLLQQTEMPPHGHDIGASSANGSTHTPAGKVLAANAAGTPVYGNVANTNLAAGTVSSEGGGQAHNNMQPFLTLNYIIALTGIFPPRS
jgi:microcystin-dependent protein